MTFKRLAIICSLGLGMVTGTVQAETQVTTYIVKTQEERQSTRWTLTEWLRIKERMRLMDVWLAMFSNPAKDRFQPELNLSYGMTRGDMTVTGSDGTTESAALTGREAKAQLWLTNILTSSTGVRTVNIDFGLEVGGRQTDRFQPEATDETAALAVDPNISGKRDLYSRYASANFRLFGKNIQDSSLVLKVGQYQSFNNLLPADPEEGSEGIVADGLLVGGELSLYLFKWLGLEGNYLSYGEQGNPRPVSTPTGSYYDYGAYLEISLLRLMAGRYVETWQMPHPDGARKVKESGLLMGAKLQF